MGNQSHRFLPSYKQNTIIYLYIWTLHCIALSSRSSCCCISGNSIIGTSQHQPQLQLKSFNNLSYSFAIQIELAKQTKKNPSNSTWATELSIFKISAIYFKLENVILILLTAWIFSQLRPHGFTVTATRIEGDFKCVHSRAPS